MWVGALTPRRSSSTPQSFEVAAHLAIEVALLEEVTMLFRPSTERAEGNKAEDDNNKQLHD